MNDRCGVFECSMCHKKYADAKCENPTREGTENPKTEDIDYILHTGMCVECYITSQYLGEATEGDQCTR